MTPKLVLVLALCGAPLAAQAQPTPTVTPTAPTPTATPGPPPRYPLIPWPSTLEPLTGSFPLQATTRIVLSDPSSAELREIAALLQDSVQLATGACVSWLQFAILGIDLSGGLKMLTVLIGAVGLSWAATAALRRSPGVSRVL